MTLIHPGRDHRPRERCVGFGIPYDDGVLIVECWRCRAPEGQRCTRRGGGNHTVRHDRARRSIQGKAMRLFAQLERAALNRDPHGQLWSFQSLPHQCEVLGPHVLTACPQGPAEETS